MKSKLMPQVAATIVFVLAMVSLALGQRVRGTDPAHDLKGSDVELRMLERQETTQVDRQAARLALAQISEDFLQIQLVNNRMMRAVVGGGALDLRFVTKSVSEIKKLATRLRNNLVLPEPAEHSRGFKMEHESGIEQLTSSLSALGEMVAEFVENPIFRKPNVVDTQLSVKARRELEEIIELSGQIKERGETLSKSASKSQ